MFSVVPVTVQYPWWLFYVNRVCVDRNGLAPDYSSENVGFRCVESDPVADTRQPVRHRLSETWMYQSGEQSIAPESRKFFEEL